MSFNGSLDNPIAFPQGGRSSLVGANLPSLSSNFSVSLQAFITYSGADNGTYFDSSGVLQTSGADAARFDHDKDGIPLGILIEE